MITPMCKVKQARCPGVLLESKPVSYPWFPVQVGPPQNLPGSILIAGGIKIPDTVWILNLQGLLRWALMGALVSKNG